MIFLNFRIICEKKTRSSHRSSPYARPRDFGRCKITCHHQVVRNQEQKKEKARLSPVVQRQFSSKNCGQMTSVSVAHRLSTIRDSDCIFVMDNGHVVECGSHEQLIENNSTYASLVEAQSGSSAV